MSTDIISISNVNKVFSRQRGDKDEYVALEDLHLEVGDGEFFCLLGPSGCGKTTLLNIVAGFERATSGSVAVFDNEVVSPGPDRGVVFQSDAALFPWLTVEENIEFGLRMRGVKKQERKEIVKKYVELVGLSHHSCRFPHELSGGMKQRVQIARVLANDPRVLLMDEPFAALDAQTRRRMQGELQRIWSATKKTVLFVTHDIGEAIILGDRVGVMTRGPSSYIKKIVSVSMSRPRDNLTPEFIQLFNEFKEEIEAEALQVDGEEQSD